MSRVSSAHGGSERGRVAHFTDHDDVRVLPEHMLQRMMERKGVETHFALFDHALIVLKDVFDGIFERNHMLFEIRVDVLDHCRKRRGLAAAG